MLSGRIEHEDSMGNRGVIGPGGVQWMTAGRGVVHSEMPVADGGLLHGFQLWWAGWGGRRGAGAGAGGCGRRLLRAGRPPPHTTPGHAPTQPHCVCA